MMVDAYLYHRGRQVLDFLEGQRGVRLSNFLNNHPELQIKAALRYAQSFAKLVSSHQIAPGSYVIVEYLNLRNRSQVYGSLQLLSARMCIASLKDDMTYSVTEDEAKTIADILQSFTLRTIMAAQQSACMSLFDVVTRRPAPPRVYAEAHPAVGGTP